MAAAHFSGYRKRGPIHDASTNRLSLCSLGGHRSSGSLFGLHWQGTTTIPHRRIPSPARCLSSAPCRNPAPWLILSRTGSALPFSPRSRWLGVVPLHLFSPSRNHSLQCGDVIIGQVTPFA